MKLTKKEREILKEFKRRIEQNYPEEKIRIFVFGSKARGDATNESDIDVMVVIRSNDRTFVKKIRHMGYELELENEIILSIQVFPQEYMDYLRSIPTQFVQNIDREAIYI